MTVFMKVLFMMSALYLRVLHYGKFVSPFFSTFFSKCRLTYCSLTYNHFMDASYMADVCMGPMFWLVDNFTNTIGSLLVLAVSGLTASVVFIAYWIGIPHWWNKNPYICIFLVTFGHWLLLNICFNYYMACTIPPGCVPEGELISETVGICKKCIAPKPPRAHHCSVCNRCILKMDHHCPWLNNCIGYRNHRYFFMYMVYMVSGVFFVILCGWDIAYAELFLDKYAEDGEPELEGHPVKFNKSGALIPVTGTVMLDAAFLEDHEVEETNLRRRCIIYMTLLNIGVFFALGCLAAWHGSLITHNETSVEMHINKAETMRMKDLGKLYVNPYDLGPRENWKQFLGCRESRSAYVQLLFPSVFEPFGDGLSWPSVSDSTTDSKRDSNTVTKYDDLERDSHIFKKCRLRVTERVQNDKQIPVDEERTSSQIMAVVSKSDDIAENVQISNRVSVGEGNMYNFKKCVPRAAKIAKSSNQISVDNNHDGKKTYNDQEGNYILYAAQS